MKTMKKFAATATLAIATLTVAAGTAYADTPAANAPAPTGPGTTVSTDVLPGIHYTANVVDHSVVLRTDAGRLVTRGNQFEILDGSGRLAFGMPLTYQLDRKDWPIAAKIDADGRTVTLTPSRDPADAITSTQPDLKPVFSQDEFNDAVGVAANQVGLATGIGVLVGTALGLVGGCVAGAVVGTALMPPLFLAGAPGGCLAGAVAGAALGVAAGTVIVGGPVAVVSVIQLFNTVTAGHK
ncbi:hypothetical protein [Nocardia vaccinii]|uniref:hypothetical protein n=1 Tax=Nocardia vaccinii TaxID=1822 RepID=UPI000A01ECFC|nr:hypothetical protein [Nocardia vaccinii]